MKKVQWENDLIPHGTITQRTTDTASKSGGFISISTVDVTRAEFRQDVVRWSADSKMEPSLCSVIVLCALMSSAWANFLSVSQHGPRLTIAKSYGVPIKLNCDDHLTRAINVSGISLFKLKRTVEADHVFPGIQAQSQSECQHTFHPVDKTRPAECELSFSGRKIPSDVMIVAIYRCVTTTDPQNQLFHTRSSETGDVVLRCGSDDMIDILDIRVNETELHEEDKEVMKQQCAMKMFQAPQQSPGPGRPVFCTVSRQGRNGDLKVKYQCLQAPQKDSGQLATHETSTGLLPMRQFRHSSQAQFRRRTSHEPNRIRI
ncbi:hypothetical protein OS493_025382 [Desmophyllum pertusum]|uniref:Uncharacterized protein n=1 Tax=Desmophyllum pertusum TaxID=174260 RepID=A0A9W9YXX9_9CNID|nr:hypothetical protein OS493_025382 [Desmophyllum pertusum]